jgi:hypothetical protein
VKRGCAALTTLTLLSVPAAAHGATPIHGFSPGRWKGTMKIEGGIDNGSIHASGQGSGTFSFTITATGQAKTGHISLGETIVTTGPDGTFNSYSYGGMPLSGGSTLVTGFGPMEFHIETPYGPIDGPVDSEVSLRPLTATCSTASGDAAIPAREFQTAAGFATNVTALFTAHRTSGAAPDQRNLDRETNTTRADVNLYLAHPANPTAAGLAAQAVKDLSRAVAAAAGCGGPPAGFARGVIGHPQLGPRLRELFKQAAAHAGALGAQQLDAVIEAAVESGASTGQMHALIAAMEGLMLQPPLNADAAGLREILKSATLYRLDELSTAAEAALTKLGGP